MTPEEVAATYFAAEDQAVLPARCFSLISLDENCGSRCAARLSSWEEHLSAYGQARLNKGFNLFHESVSFSDFHVDASIFEKPLAILDVPSSVEEYELAIGDKSRNMIRKALRSGYAYREVEGKNFLQDIFDIRNSVPARRGIPIPDYWKKPASPPTNNHGLCSKHGDTFYGIFSEEKLVAYCTLRHFGEIAEINQLLGHDAHLNFGVMNLLMHHVIRKLREDYPWVRAVSYLYPDESTSLGLFKKGIGFTPTWTITSLGRPEVTLAVQSMLPQPKRQVQDEPNVKRTRTFEVESSLLWDGGPFRPDRQRFHLVDLLRELEINIEDNALIIGEAVPEVGEALEQLGAQCRTSENDSVDVDDLGIVFISPTPLQVVSILGKSLPRLAKKLRDRGWLAVKFVYDIDRCLSRGMLAVGDANALKALYLRRFKIEVPTKKEFSRAFIGSDFQFKGLIDDVGSQDESRGVGWLMLRKITAS